MRCRHCHSQMLPTEQQLEGRSQQTSFLCPLCGATAASFRRLAVHEVTCCPRSLGSGPQAPGLSQRLRIALASG